MTDRVRIRFGVGGDTISGCRRRWERIYERRKRRVTPSLFDEGADAEVILSREAHPCEFTALNHQLISFGIQVRGYCRARWHGGRARAMKLCSEI